jgi:hypothetical protein
MAAKTFTFLARQRSTTSAMVRESNPRIDDYAVPVDCRTLARFIGPSLIYANDAHFIRENSC